MPVLAAILLAVVQLAVLMADQVRVVDAAREAARTATVGGEASAATAAAAADGLVADRLAVTVTRADGVVTATVRYRAPTNVPLVRAWSPAVLLTARTSMLDESPKVEQPP